MESIEIEFLTESNLIEQVPGLTDGAVNAWQFAKTQKKWSQNSFCKAHRLLMADQPIPARYKGKYRDVQVMVGGRLGVPVENIQRLMKAFYEYINTFPQDWKAAHVEFERIHPFIDGNGRIGRILMNWHRLKIDKPILVIKEEGKYDYYKWF